MKSWSNYAKYQNFMPWLNYYYGSYILAWNLLVWSYTTWYEPFQIQALTYPPAVYEFIGSKEKSCIPCGSGTAETMDTVHILPCNCLLKYQFQAKIFPPALYKLLGARWKKVVFRAGAVSHNKLDFCSSTIFNFVPGAARQGVLTTRYLGLVFILFKTLRTCRRAWLARVVF